MLYRYKPEEKNRYETIYSNGSRVDSYTGEILPTIPVYGNATTVKTDNVADAPSGSTSAKKKAASSKNTRAAASQPSAADQAKLLLAQEQAKLLEQQKAALEKNRSEAMKLLGDNLAASQNGAKAANDDAMRQLYIAYMQGIKNIPQQSALWGAGGEVESLKTQHRLNYEDNRAKQMAGYNSVLGEIQNRYNEDLLELENKYLSQLMGLGI